MRVLLSWIGGSDLKAAANESEAQAKDDVGPLWRLLRRESFDRIHLLNDFAANGFQGFEPNTVQGYAQWLAGVVSLPGSVNVVLCDAGGRPIDGNVWDKTARVVVHDATEGRPTGFHNHLADTFSFSRGVFRQVRDCYPDASFCLLTSAGMPAAQAAMLILSQTVFGGRVTLYSTFKADHGEGIEEQRLPFVIPVDVLETTQSILRAAPEADAGRSEELHPAFHPILGESQVMQHAKYAAQRMATCPFSVLILGESGTGKELFAKAIHTASGRRGSFVPVNCGALDHGIVDSVLFGHEKGAFTGAQARQDGKFHAAKGGTIFLDELGNLPLGTQMKLLRVLNNGEVERLGSNKPDKVDVRVIAATNADLWAAIGAGTFREDLYYRVATLPLHLPPLKERGSDLGILAEEFLRETCRTLNVTRQFTEDAVTQLYRYPWRGNVRELESAIQRLVVLCPSEDITAAHVEAVLGRPSPAAAAALVEQTDTQFVTQLAAVIDELLCRYEAGRGLPLAPQESDLIGEILKPLIFGRAMHLKQGDKKAAGRMFKEKKLDTSPSKNGPEVEQYEQVFRPRIDEAIVARLRGTARKGQP